ncbi:HTH-type transcriptional repressor of iron proteins A [compost metagenome]
MDLSEWVEGPWLIALRGGDTPDSEYALGTREYEWHQHARGQVICVEAGMIQVRTSHGSWLLPPRRAGWMPPDVSHQVRVSGALAGWSLLLAPAACESLPHHPCVIGISEVLRVLVNRAETWDQHELLSPDQDRIAHVILDEIGRAPHESLHLPMPGDPRLVRVARAMLDEPGSPRTLEDWAVLGAMSPRTLRRLIQAETGLSFAQWRQQAQLTHALERLARGEPVNQVSDALGYASPSNFIAMFRRAFGDSPAHYFSKNPK